MSVLELDVCSISLLLSSKPYIADRYSTMNYSTKYGQPGTEAFLFCLGMNFRTSPECHSKKLQTDPYELISFRFTSFLYHGTMSQPSLTLLQYVSMRGFLRGPYRKIQVFYNKKYYLCFSKKNLRFTAEHDQNGSSKACMAF